jgi:hypothetical protein
MSSDFARGRAAHRDPRGVEEKADAVRRRGTFTTVQFVWKADFRFQSHSMTLVECSAEGMIRPPLRTTLVPYN